MEDRKHNTASAPKHGRMGHGMNNAAGEKAKNFALSKMNWEYRAKQISDIYNEVVK